MTLIFPTKNFACLSLYCTNFHNFFSIFFCTCNELTWQNKLELSSGCILWCVCVCECIKLFPSLDIRICSYYSMYISLQCYSYKINRIGTSVCVQEQASWPPCLNFSLLRGQKLTFYHGMECRIFYTSISMEKIQILFWQETRQQERVESFGNDNTAHRLRTITTIYVITSQMIILQYPL